jgi:hypothetical protein
MVAPIDKVRGEGNCARATVGGKEACECVVKLTNPVVVSRILTSAARLRTETPGHQREALVGPVRAGE